MVSDILSAALSEMREYDDSVLYQGADRQMVDDLIGHMELVLTHLDTPPTLAEQNEKMKTL